MNELFRRCASGTTTISQLAAWLSDAGFRARKTRKLPDVERGLTGGGRLFTTASVRIILNNACYTGKVKHHDQLLPGAHEALSLRSCFRRGRPPSKRTTGGRKR